MTTETPVGEYSTTITDERPTGERADLLAALRQARYFMRLTTEGMDDEQAGRRTTVSELCLGGLIKHVTVTERVWAAFVEFGPAALPDFMNFTEADYRRRAEEFRLLPGETLAGVLAAYEAVAAATDQLVAGLTDADLNTGYQLPPAPWDLNPEIRSVRRALLGIIAETTHHAGHADIIREAIDGAKSMG
ncbi:DinB family protein [Kitasatospora sp. CB02891]|uniref:DinB family protein n=1 Tax=Kitasatospora sp. CB02891 TaxID=2020329 RepID=UPI001E5B4D75|nr:DinB family protein [Kitasatospora sp. CB02891]